jgi:hypothetical protein
MAAGTEGFNSTTKRIITNNASLDPIQGFHLNVYMNDQASGLPVLVGGFTSFQKTMRNATEAYMPFGRKHARLLDGEFQYGWVLERGLLDIGILKDIFGVNDVGPEFRAEPTPRFTITVEINAPELHDKGINFPITSQYSQTGDSQKRSAKGKYQLIFAKIDSVTLGAMAGRSVVATRFEGLCESIRFIEDGNFLNNSGSRLDSGNPGTTGFSSTTNLSLGQSNGNKGGNYLYL